MSDGHARHRLDDLLLHPVRLSLVATLATVEEAEFGVVRDAIEVSDSVLSKQVTALSGRDRCYVTMRKGYVGRRPRTWLKLTADGQLALARHLAALREIAEG